MARILRPIGLVVLPVLLALAAVAGAKAISDAQSTVLHVELRRAGTNADAFLEGWVDTTTREGKVIERGPDGNVRRVEVLSGQIYTMYLPDGKSAVIRRIRPDSALADRIREQLLFYRVGVERGMAKLIGSGQVDGRSTDRVEARGEGGIIIADIDKATGLTLREELTPPGGTGQVIERKYSVIEHLPRAAVPSGAFSIDLPPDTRIEEYNDADPLGDAASRPYAVYTAASQGPPVHISRIRVLDQETGGGDAVAVIYRGNDGEVQVQSGLPPDSPAVPESKPILPSSSVEQQIDGVSWMVESRITQVRGSAHLSDAYVTILAPTNEVFQRVATSLERANP